MRRVPIWVRRASAIAIAFMTITSASGSTLRGEDYAALLQAADDAGNQGLGTVLRWAVKGHQRIQREIRDYTCIMVKRERVNGRLRDFEFMYAKVRNRRDSGGRKIPFSVYLRFLAPSEIKDREVLWVEGQNDGRMVARNGGRRFSFVTTTLDPNSDLAMRDNRYPITKFGVVNLVDDLIRVARDGIQVESAKVSYFKDARVDKRVCIGVEVEQTRRTPQSRFFRARIFIDRELRIPIHYESYDWPEEEGGEPLLLEQYTYRDIRLNVGLTDADFRRDNPKYGFR